mgnify:FL=1
MLFNLLAEEGGKGFNLQTLIPIIIIVVLLVAFFVWSFISQRKKQKNFNETIAAVRPGSKVKTIGGIVGTVVEVDDEEGTFVLRTGDSAGNESYMKFDKQAIYQTDAKPAPAESKAEEAPAAEEPAQAEAPAEEAPAETEKTEEKSEDENK